MKFTYNTFISEIQLYRILLKFFKILGLAPFNVHLIPSAQNKKEQQFDINYTYSFEESAYDFILSVCLLFKIIYDFVHQHFENAYQHLYHIVNNFSLMMIITSYCLKQKLSAKIITNLTYLESELACKSWDYSFKITSVKKYCIAITIFFTINFIAIIVFHALWSANQTIETYVTLSSLFITEVCVIQYASVMIFLYQRFKTLNSSLLVLANNNNGFNYLGLWTNSIRNNITNQKLIFLRQAHRLLYNCLCDTTKFYSVPILFAVLSNFPILLLSVESLIRTKFTSEELFNMGLHVDFGIGLLIVFSLAPISVLCFFVTKIITEMKRTKDNVSKIITVRSSDGLFKDELEKFYIELLHANYNITACGFFKIDNSLLSLIFTGIIVYCFTVQQAHEKENEGFLLSSFISII
ncbi:uncharacterized protein LOC123269181 [Cotesia glomerata]|uniref:Gustatory receptor n=1 Tax=Cotesia glomerata TaxID=32391 RepID=A0AAV7IBZ6_COTGL|nr:uncharacterized protein LOC123269181 [Cotesia glomerata]KAH0546918.1 hypothetical protein KQX54_016021 [Cotesia glomerata]